MTAKNPMQPLYDKLAALGVKKPLVKQLLPDWWDDDVAASPAGFQSAAMRLARLFSLRFSSLAGEGPAEFALTPRCFKRQNHIDIDRLDLASSLAFLACRLTLRAFERPFTSESLSAADLRERLLERGNPWVDFQGLVDLCWELGIPVVFAPSLPSPKMQGLALKIEGRPAIVLTSGRKYGYLVFDLAHELGHIILGHVSDKSWVIDQKIDAHAKDEDAQSIDIELEANRFALELLTDNPHTQFSSRFRLTGEQLAHQSLVYGRKNKIDPMHIALNYAYSKNMMAVGNIAINNLVSELAINESDQDFCRAVFLRHVDIENLDDDERTLRQLIGASIA